MRALVGLAALVVGVALVPLGASVATPQVPASNCSPGFGGGLFCWVWVGNGCESEIYLPPDPLLFPGPGDATPHAFVYGCAATSCYNDVETGGMRCVANPVGACFVDARTGPFPTDPRFGEAFPHVVHSGCTA